MYDRLKFLDHPKEDQDRVEKSDLSKDKVISAKLGLKKWLFSL